MFACAPTSVGERSRWQSSKSRRSPSLRLSRGVLAGPEPAEGPSGQQAVDKSVDDFFDRHRPGLTLPNTVADVSQTVGEESGGPGDAEYRSIVCAERNRVRGEVGDEETDQQAIDKPLSHKFRHGRRPARHDGRKPDWSQLVLLEGGG